MSDIAAYAGEPGAFGEEACMTCFPGLEAEGLADFAAVASAVIEDRAAAGVLPVRNSRAGTVPGVAALLKLPGLRIAGHYPLPVIMHCVGLPGANLSELREVRSHPVALRQSWRFLTSLGVAVRPASDTAGAAREVAELGDRTVAALASTRAAVLYRLEVLQARVQDEAENVTTFALLERSCRFTASSF